MPVNLKGRSYLTLDFSTEEIEYLLELSRQLKNLKITGTPHRYLEGKNIVLLFQKTSTRTRCSFEVGAMDLGMGVTYLDPGSSQMGKKESIEDTARVLGRFYDGIEFRGFAQQTAVDLAKHSGVPVWNGLTDLYHPTQALADIMTLEEHATKPLKQCKLVYVGDARNNVANSLMIICAKLGLRYAAVCPKELKPEAGLLKEMKALARETGGEIQVTHDLSGVRDADAVYTDVWVSMGEEAQFASRIKLLKDYRVDRALMDKTGNPGCIFLHCLPAFHNAETVVGREVIEATGMDDGLEVTEEVFESAASIVFDQAENRMHSIKAILVSTLT